jgi:hypothetical protein
MSSIIHWGLLQLADANDDIAVFDEIFYALSLEEQPFSEDSEPEEE